MSIFLGSSQLSGLFGTAVTAGPGATAFGNPAPPISGGAVALNAGLFPNTSSVWTNYNGNVFVQNAPLVGTSSIGFYQFNGTNDQLFLSGGLYTNGLFQGNNGTQSFTMMFYGTVGDLSTQNRALFGNPQYNTTPSGSDAIFRIDTSPPAGYCTLDMRTSQALGGRFNRFSVPYSSGSIMNIAVTYDATTTSASLYVDGILTQTSGGFAGAQYTPWYNNGGNGPIFGTSNGINAVDFNGTLGGFYVYNRILTGTQISQSAAWFSQGNTVIPAQASGIQDINTAYLGSNLLYTKPTTTTTTTTSTTSTTTTSTTSTTKPPLSVMTLVIGGGGAGGVGTGGGGGAGGVVYSSSLSLTPGTYATNVGTGGLQSAGPVGLNRSTQSGNFGQTSSFQSGSISVIAVGGGGGAAYETSTAFAKSGGSGGGGSNFSTYRAGGAGTTGQGNAGGTVTSNPNGSGAGGGGASQAGAGAEVAGRGAPGGSGSAYTIRDGNSVFYGGGGGAGSYHTTPGGLASAGGGQGGNASGGAGFSGSANTGGGGGGSNRNVDGTVNGAGGAGGSGIIIIAYLTSSFSASAATAVSGGIITDYTSGSAVYRSHTFLSSSNLVIS